MPTNIVTSRKIAPSLRGRWVWFLFIGIVFVIGGIFAIALPLVSSFAVGSLLAAILIIVGVVQLMQAFRVRDWGGFLWQLVIGIVVFAGGVAAWFNPLLASFFLTALIAAAFVIKGGFQIMMAFRLRPHHGWVWLLVAGLIALIAGIAIYLEYPFSGLWVPGTLAGISLLFTGWSYIAVALAARRADL